MSKPKPVAPQHLAPEKAIDDEPVHVPKGQSRMRFVIILGLMVFTLVIYVVPRQLQSAFERSVGDGGSYVSWKLPGHAKESLSTGQFQSKRRVFDSFLNVSNNERVSRALLDDAGLARLLIVDQLARDAGVDVSDGEIGKAILEGQFLMIGMQFLYVRPFQEKKNFIDACQVYRTSPKEFEDTLRTMMRIDRYERLLGFAMAQPDPTSFEADWKKQHQEHAFDAVTLDLGASLIEAGNSVPADAELKAWYDALPNPEKNRSFSADWKPERVSAELVGWRFDPTTDPTALLAKYPRPEGADLEQIAKDYYNQFANVRFRRPQEKEGAADDHDRLYFSFDEVADAARRESKVHAAFVDWHNALQSRATAGETIDLAAEATTLGLSYRKEEPKSQVDWNALADIGGPLLTQKIMTAARGDKNIDVFVGEQDIQTGRVLERLPAGPPPFEDVREKVQDEWKQQKAVSLAQGRMAELRAQLAQKDPAAEPASEPKPGDKVIVDAQTFESKATAMNLQRVHADWFDPAKLANELPASPTDLDRFFVHFRATPEYSTAAEGEVIGPRVDSDRQRVWLVRAAGVRDPAVVALQPKDYEMLRNNAAQEAQRKFREETLGAKTFEKSFELTFSKPSETDGDTPKG